MSDVTYDRMAASLGSLLLLWARIERAARAEIVREYGVLPKSAYGISTALRTWQGTVSDPPETASLNTLLAETLRNQLQRPLGMRNGLCHGLIGIASANGTSPGRLMWELNGVEEYIGWEDLQEMFGWLSKIPDVISMISRPPSERICDRRIDSRENRDWWRAEFALRLP